MANTLDSTRSKYGPKSILFAGEVVFAVPLKLKEKQPWWVPGAIPGIPYLTPRLIIN
ncbi:hypothetical protein [Desulfitobacterium dehalogenans]|uniref:hypothetical protein n=1 Tax=Desulfitobacterium TaxID=36853 RepID=UPI000303FF29|nr:hypothetical protein [Desulfitobacterium dehalogenans]